MDNSGHSAGSHHSGSGAGGGGDQRRYSNQMPWQQQHQYSPPTYQQQLAPAPSSTNNDANNMMQIQYQQQQLQQLQKMQAKQRQQRQQQAHSSTTTNQQQYMPSPPPPPPAAAAAATAATAPAPPMQLPQTSSFHQRPANNGSIGPPLPSQKPISQVAPKPINNQPIAMSNSNNNNYANDIKSMSSGRPLAPMPPPPGAPTPKPPPPLPVGVERQSSISSRSSNVVAQLKKPSLSGPTPAAADGSGGGADNKSAAPKAAPEPAIDVQALTAECTWEDKVVLISKQLLGGQAVNGFLKATATVQRIKKQRARQMKLHKDTTSVDDIASKSSAGAAAAATGTKRLGESASSGGGGGGGGGGGLSEEELKDQIMNVRTAKKLKSEMEAGMLFCMQLHDTVRAVLGELHSHAGSFAPPPPPPLHQRPPSPPMAVSGMALAPLPSMRGLSPMAQAQQTVTNKPSKGSAPSGSKKDKTVSHAPAPAALPPFLKPVQQRATSTASSQQTPPGITTENPSGAMLRKNRKKRLPALVKDAQIQLSEFDANKKRVMSKKEHTYRVFECLRFRTLRPGDICAARLTSRDLWILAKVVKDYVGNESMAAVEFLQLTEARREQLFREKVAVQDVEDKGSTVVPVARSLVLPLPRSYSEAADWASRYRKGMRVYAMYPETTSLYSATVHDASTYCRDDDDIVVVQFDGDEPDATGATAKCHIPARFVVLIPRDFAASQPPKESKKKSATPAAAPLAVSAPAPLAPKPAKLADPLDALPDLNFEGMSTLDDFEDLEFDLGLG